MAPTALAININIAGESKSLPTAAKARAASASGPTSPSPTSPNEGTPLSPPVICNSERRYKEVAVPPGRLGIGIKFEKLENENQSSAVIWNIDPAACSFKDEVQIGDRIVNIDGNAVNELDDFLVGMEKVRIFRIMPRGKGDGEGAHDVNTDAATEMKAGERGSEEQNNETHVISNQQLSTLGKRKQKKIESTGTSAPAEKRAKTTNGSAEQEFNKRMKGWATYQEKNQIHLRDFNKWKEDWTTYQSKSREYYINRYADGWGRRFRELQQYKQSGGGNVNKIPLDYRDPNDITLGEWARLQRELYWEGKLDQERINHLAGEGFDFEYEPSVENAVFVGDEKWDGKLLELIKFKREFHHADVPFDHPNEQTLGQWVKEQRDMYEAGTLEGLRHTLLEQIGFVFEPGTNMKKTVIDEAWRRNYEELVQFKRNHGHLEVKRDYKATSTSSRLGQWIYSQRNMYKRNELPKSKLRLLEEVGLQLPTDKTIRTVVGDPWRTNYDELVQFKRDHGHLEVPKDYRATDTSNKLHVWITHQRQKYRNKELPENKIRLFEEIGLHLAAGKKRKDREWYYEKIFESNFNDLLQYRKKHGHANVPKRFGKLGNWVGAQRRCFRRGELSEDKIKRFEEIGFEFDPLKKGGGNDSPTTPAAAAAAHMANTSSHKSLDFESHIWLDTYGALKSFAEINGHTNVPLGYVSEKVGCCLHTWLETQKKFFEQDMLPQCQIQMLEELGIDLSKNSQNLSESVAWTMNFNVLKDFYDEYGHTDAPYNHTCYGGYSSLALWIQYQQEMYRKKRLAQDRIERLENIGIDLDEERDPSSKSTGYSILGKMPNDNLWFDDNDGKRKRVPSTWTFPMVSLEEIYVLYHCHSYFEGDIDKKMSPMKLFTPSDMHGVKRGTQCLKDIQKLCGIIDEGCVESGVEVDGVMTEGDARRCVRIGHHALNIPPCNDGTQRDILKMKWSTAYGRKTRPIRVKDAITIPLEKKEPMAGPKDYSILGKMPDDDLWFDHNDGTRKRVPSTWTRPKKLCLEEIYVLYHCHRHLEGDKERKISPMKLFKPADVAHLDRGIWYLSNMKHACRIIDEGCIKRGVEVEGIMTEEDARRCVRIGCYALNIPPCANGKPRDVLKMSLWTALRLKNPQGR